MVDLLEKYRQKRRADGTPEPFGRAAGSRSGPLRFVVHHHAARNTHFDLRLEMEGVLRSWAVPKGPSPNIKDKRFAALVEDHPVEYGDFEGKIPDGNYGAGWTIVWDRGTWIPKSDPLLGLQKGKLLFELRGHKLHGKWTLVRMRSGDKDWLLIKEYDDFMDEESSTEDYDMGSVFTGLSLEQLNAGTDPARPIRKMIKASKPPRRVIRSLKPMLAQAGQAFTRKDWLFEVKYDGYRLICKKDGDEVLLSSRNGNDLSDTFPEIAMAVQRLPFDQFIMDGEAVCHDSRGMPSFARMQKRGRLTKPSAIQQAMIINPATLMAFDMLAFDGYDLRDLPLIRRKEILRELVPAVGVIRYSDHIEREGRAMYTASHQLGIEGIVGKRANSPYKAGRSDAWVKVRVEQTDDFVIMGWRESESGQLRSLNLGQYIGGELTYSGQVGTGFSQTTLKELETSLNALDVVQAPADAPSIDLLHWVKSVLVCEVKFKEITPAGQLRHPVFLRMRDDKAAQECTREFKTHDLPEPEVDQEAAEKTVVLSNLGKVFWPDEGYTKGDMLAYYDAIAPWLLPWLKDRPLVMTRFPDGIEGKSFYQKDAPGFVPDWVRIESLYSESTERDIGYLVVDSTEALVYIANMASIPLHIYHSRMQQLERPDWCVIDLDPKEAPFKDVITIAKALHSLCDEIELPNFVKTSGSTGLHILVPLNNQFTFEQSRVLGELLARIIVTRLPDIATVTRNPAGRDGKVYIDYLQNGSGKLIAAPYCVRPLPGAPVSMPITWHEVNKGLTPDKFTIKNAVTRMKRRKTDPALEVLSANVDLLAVLQQLTGHFEAER